MRMQRQTALTFTQSEGEFLFKVVACLSLCCLPRERMVLLRDNLPFYFMMLERGGFS